MLNDYVTLSVKPMYCSYASDLGYSSDSSYTDYCISSGTATVYVNSANAYFNITGSATFEYIKFTGIN